ncbi:MAG TPA: sulfur carrier protein ThiS [Candidatus Methylomirabilis sp.]|nr:sulfur carrier protein ThiS [Candidatus Methylomirabilis sp.]
MNVTVNGKSMELPDGLTIEGLLTHLGVRREYTAVALNREVTPKHQYGQSVLREGDKIEIVRPMGGG